MNTSRCFGCNKQKEIFSQELSLCSDCLQTAKNSLAQYQKLCEEAEDLASSNLKDTTNYQFTSIWIELNRIWSNWGKTREIGFFSEQIDSLLRRYKTARINFVQNYEQEKLKKFGILPYLRKMTEKVNKLTIECLQDKNQSQSAHGVAMRIFLDLTRLRQESQTRCLNTEEIKVFEDLTSALRKFFFHYRCSLGETRTVLQ